ncbi:PadR family transcriptional regulator [Longispora albida]|uniref:PadR family transcriptional regulator n=1 Tax=Longispora albida TaxID=203523 RepID=UPI000374C172|nr:PadR family transcriptional regulator [Longispora albida]
MRHHAEHHHGERREHCDRRGEHGGRGRGFTGHGSGGRGGPERLAFAFGPFGPFGGGRGRGHGGRGRGRGARRGDVRAAILGLLAERPMHGYEMINELDQRTSGAWRPSPGSVYPTLQLLEDEGLISGQESEGRKRFSLTEAGQTEAATLDTPPWTQISEEAGQSAHDLRAAAMGIMQAMGQVMAVGSAEQQERALAILSETRRKLYGLLSE